MLIRLFIINNCTTIAKYFYSRLCYYLGVMMVKLGYADGMVSGATCVSAEAIYPALQIIKTKHNLTKASGAMLMIKHDKGTLHFCRRRR